MIVQNRLKHLTFATAEAHRTADQGPIARARKDRFDEPGQQNTRDPVTTFQQRLEGFLQFGARLTVRHQSFGSDTKQWERVGFVKSFGYRNHPGFRIPVYDFRYQQRRGRRNTGVYDVEGTLGKR